MAMLGRVIALIPLVLCIVSAILTALVLFAGHEKGFMEDYAVARLNTSMVGHNMIDLTSDDDTSNDNDDDDDDGGFFDDLSDDVKDKWDDVEQDIEDGLNDITGSIADELAEELGISEWYSIHVMAACEGFYKGNATASKGLNTTNCTQTAPSHAFNLTKMLDHELSAGPVDISLADLDWPDAIQDAVDFINDVLLALFVIYVLGLCFSGIGVFTALAAVFLAEKRSIVLINFIVTALAAVCITVGSILVTVGVTKGIDEINDVGDDVGIKATRGDGFLGMTWAAAAMMLLTVAIWTVRFCMVWKESKRARAEHKKYNI